MGSLVVDGNLTPPRLSPVDVSIIVCAYNAADTLSEALHSVASQDFDGTIECVLIDDGSSDATQEVMEQFARTREHVSVIGQKNAGVGTARNIALDAATGSSVLFLDADDLLPPGALSSLHQAKAATGARMSAGAMARYPGSPAWPLSAEFETAATIVDIRKRPRLLLNRSMANKLIDRTHFDNPEHRFSEGQVHEDMPTSTIAWLSLTPITLVPETVYLYRRRAESIMGTAFDSVSGYVDHLAGLERVLAWDDGRHSDLLAAFLIRAHGPFLNRAITSLSDGGELEAYLERARTLVENIDPPALARALHGASILTALTVHGLLTGNRRAMSGDLSTITAVTRTTSGTSMLVGSDAPSEANQLVLETLANRTFEPRWTITDAVVDNDHLRLTGHGVFPADRQHLDMHLLEPHLVADGTSLAPIRLDTDTGTTGSLKWTSSLALDVLRTVSGGLGVGLVGYAKPRKLSLVGGPFSVSSRRWWPTSTVSLNQSKDRVTFTVSAQRRFRR